MKPRVNCLLQLAVNFMASLELLSLVLIQVVEFGPYSPPNFQFKIL